MNLRLRSVLAAFAALAVLPASRSAAAASGADPALLVPIDTLISSIVNQAPQSMPAAFAPSSTILDDLPPNHFSGPRAYAQWYDAFAASLKAQNMRVTYLAHGSPTYAHVSSDVAYVVVPADFTFTVAGKPFAESAAWTFSLVKSGGRWKIAAWAWALLTSTAE